MGNWNSCSRLSRSGGLRANIILWSWPRSGQIFFINILLRSSRQTWKKITKILKTPNPRTFRREAAKILGYFSIKEWKIWEGGNFFPISQENNHQWFTKFSSNLQLKFTVRDFNLHISPQFRYCPRFSFSIYRYINLYYRPRFQFTIIIVSDSNYIDTICRPRFQFTNFPSRFQFVYYRMCKLK